jgi:P-type Mg2+ transporter
MTGAPSGPLGLTTAEAAAQLGRWGPNEVETGKRFRLLREGLGLLGNPLVLILLAASVISGFLGEALDAAIIIVVVLLSVGLDFFQVFRSEQAANRLKSLIAPTTRVWRDGHPVEIDVRDVVPRDVLDLRAGDLVAADATLLTRGPMSMDEAALTGESLPAEKRGGSDSQMAQLFAGTSVVSGVGQAQVTATGTHTQFGAIAHALVEKAPPTEFERGARSFGFIITRTVAGLVLFVFLVNALRQQDPLQAFLFALALAVGLTPEFLPMIMTVTLAEGAQRMARENVIVRRLEAIENLGNMDILCSDKTGTLTRGSVTVQAQVDAWGRTSTDVLRWAAVNSGLETGMQNMLDAAILAAEHESLTAYHKVAEAPFDFERRRVSVLATGPDGTQVVTKGAPEAILALCTSVDSPAGPVALSAEVEQQVETTLDGLSRAGYHVLGIARKAVVAEKDSLTVEDEQNLTLSGFVAFLDPPDPSARATLARLAAVGLSMKILSGDSDLVTRTICEQVGLRHERVVVGDELGRMSDAALWAVVEQVDAFARVSPAQKNRVIRALKHRGHVVGYLGDGINDAPSLHAADVGISVSNGVEVAKAAADIILLEKSLAAIERGVIEGRKSFGNITKYVLMGTSSNFGNMLSMALASAVLPFLPMLPVQILLNNFLYDFSQLTIPTDNVDPSYTARPRKWDTAMIQRFMFGLGPISSVYDFLTFGVMLGVFHAGPELFRAGWFIESLATQTLVIFVIRTAGNPFRSRPSTPLLVTVLGGVMAGLVVVLTPLGNLLGFDLLPPAFFVVLVVMIVTYLAIVQLVKGRFYEASGWRAEVSRTDPA